MKKVVVPIVLTLSSLVVLPSIIRSQYPVTSTNQGNIESRLLAIEDQGRKQDVLLCSLFDKVHQNSIININLTRLLILLEERRKQIAKVDSIMAEIEQINSQSSQEPNQTMYDSQLRQLEVMITSTNDPIEHSALVESYNSLKRSAENEKDQHVQSVENNQNRLQQLQPVLVDEKAKLDELEKNILLIDRYIQSVNVERKTNTCGLR